MKRILFLATTLIFLQQAAAQPGIQVGWNTSNYSYYVNDTKRDRSLLFGFNAGLLYRLSLGPVSLQPSLLFQQKGAVNPNNGSIGNFTPGVASFTNRLNYLEFGLPVLYNVDLGIGRNWSFDFGAGPYLAGLLEAHVKTEYLDGSKTTTKYSIGNDSGDDFKGLDAGFSFLLGARLNHFFTNVTYDLGVSDVDPKKISTIRNRTFSLNIGVFF